MKKVFRINDISQIAQEIIDQIIQGTDAQVIALNGDLGAGKTTLTQNLARILGVESDVNSPTFNIIKFYNTKNNKFTQLVHIDAYRLDNKDELSRLGFEDILKDKNNLIVIEWADKVLEILPSQTLRIEIEHVDDTTRSINF